MREDELKNRVVRQTFLSVCAVEKLRAINSIWINLLFERISDFCLNSADGEPS